MNTGAESSARAAADQPQAAPQLSSILETSQSYDPSANSTTGTSSPVSFPAGDHPEHSHSDHTHCHPASRPAFARRASTDTIPDTSSSGYATDLASDRRAASPGRTPSSREQSPVRSHHGILKMPSSHRRTPSDITKYSPSPLASPPIETASGAAPSTSSVRSVKTGYERRVGFDSMTDADETASGTFAFTLQVKSHGYQRTRNTRSFMCAMDRNTYSERAMEWLMDNLVEDNDEIVAVTVLEGEPEYIDQDAAREAARELLSEILTLNEAVNDRKISVVVEFVAGRVTSTILRLIHMYRPDSLTIGTRGRSVNTFQKLIGGPLIGGSSRDILARSPVPVVVVRPEAKVAKHLLRRQADPKRRTYHDLVAQASDLPLTKPRGKKSSSSILSPPHLPSAPLLSPSPPSSASTHRKSESAG